MEGRNEGTKGKSSKQGLTSAKDLTIELSEGRECRYPRWSHNNGYPYSPSKLYRKLSILSTLSSYISTLKGTDTIKIAKDRNLEDYY